MNSHSFTEWLALALTLGPALAYEIGLVIVARHQPSRLARLAHATLRVDWFSALSEQRGSEIVAVQTLRNSLMSASMTASTALLSLLGSVTLTAPSLNTLFQQTTIAPITPRLVLEFTVLVLLFGSLLTATIAVRYFNHSSFIGAMPVGSETRVRWQAAGAVYVRRAGLLYSWSLRLLMMVGPIVAALLHPFAGPPAALMLVGALLAFDRMSTDPLKS